MTRGAGMALEASQGHTQVDLSLPSDKTWLAGSNKIPLLTSLGPCALLE